MAVARPVPRRFVVISFVGLAIAGCTRDKGGVPADPVAGGTQGAAGASTPGRDCPLTAEQVSAAVGAPVKGPDSSCSFFHETKIVPSAAYNRQLPVACPGSAPAGMEELHGLGQPAYIADRADGSWILVCRSGTPFEVRVDAGTEKTARAAATALARQILATR